MQDEVRTPSSQTTTQTHETDPNAVLDAVLPEGLKQWLAEDPRRFVDISDTADVPVETRSDVRRRLMALDEFAPSDGVNALADVFAGYGSGEQIGPRDVFWMLGHLERVAVAGLPDQFACELAWAANEFHESDVFFAQIRYVVREIAEAVNEAPPLPADVWGPGEAPNPMRGLVRKRRPGTPRIWKKN